MINNYELQRVIRKVAEYILARRNNRTIPREDRIFGISNRAKKMIAEKGADKVINATIGSLLDDDGNLIVLSSVDEVFQDAQAGGIRRLCADRGHTGIQGSCKESGIRKL